MALNLSELQELAVPRPRVKPGHNHLEEMYDVSWRNHPREMAYASDYVTKRRLVINGIQKWAGLQGLTNKKLMDMLNERDKERVMTELLDIFRKGDSRDPLEMIKPRYKGRSRERRMSGWGTKGAGIRMSLNPTTTFGS